MKINNLHILTMLILFSVLVTAATNIIIVEDSVVDQSATVGTWHLDHGLTNLTDGNISTYVRTLVNETSALTNFTKQDGSDSLSIVQITYNTSSGKVSTNYSMADFLKCWDNETVATTKVIFRLTSNFTQNISNPIAFENFTWINATPVTLSNTRIVDIRVFNRTVTSDITNETNFTNSNLVWANGTNTSVLNRNIVSDIRIFNNSVIISVLNETNTTGNNLIWGNGTNMTLANVLIDNTSVKLMNCTSGLQIGDGNFTVFPADGNIFIDSNVSIPDGSVICANYSYQGAGFGTELGSGNFSAFTDGNIFMSSTSTFSNGTGFGVNYTFHTEGFGNIINSSNYTVNYLNGSITLTSNLHNNTLMGVNYSVLTDSTPKNKRECNNGSDWILLDSESDEDEIFDIRMFWSIPGSNWTLTIHRIEPDQYTTYTSLAVPFNVTLNITNSPNNQTTVNVSLWTRINNASGLFTLNSSREVLNNNTVFNKTLTFTDGDRVWWYFSFEDNQSRIIENTSIRLLDIDTVYSQMAVGTGINFTMFGPNAGNANFQGTITAANLISNGGITSQLNASPQCNITVTSGIITGFAGCNVVS